VQRMCRSEISDFESDQGSGGVAVCFSETL